MISNVEFGIWNFEIRSPKSEIRNKNAGSFTLSRAP
jgi:hypothetical protein